MESGFVMESGCIFQCVILVIMEPFDLSFTKLVCFSLYCFKDLRFHCCLTKDCREFYPVLKPCLLSVLNLYLFIATDVNRNHAGYEWNFSIWLTVPTYSLPGISLFSIFQIPCWNFFRLCCSLHSSYLRSSESGCLHQIPLPTGGSGCSLYLLGLLDN